MLRACHLGALATVVASLGALGACAPSGTAPSLDALADQVAFVGSELTVTLRASDPDHDNLSYSFASSIPGLATRAQIRPFGDGSSAELVWTPIASDVGVWAIDITVSDGDQGDTETVTIEVKTSEGAGAPIFRKPLGTGTTLDLAVKDCLDVDILIEDADSSSVTITQKEPVIEGAGLEQSGPFTALWHWCPTAAQIDAQDRYSLVLAAADGQSPETIKNYLIVLRKAPKPNCEGLPPEVAHTPANESTQLSLVIPVAISDDLGLKNEPLLYYSSTPPASPPDLGAMQQTTMLLISGDMTSGTWAADVPNPVASMPMGASATIYYVVVATDNDDAAGDCDHLTQAPVQGAFSMKVTNPGGTGGLAPCEACTADAQCGDADDNCVRIGNMGQSFCGRSCTTDAECPTDHYCSITMLTSVDNVDARQCIPESYSCSAEPPPPLCQDDAREDNDSRTAAASLPPLGAGSYLLTSCPAGTSTMIDDEDWFELDVSADASVTITLAGGTVTDLDLALVDAAGATLLKSESASSNESLTRCLTPGLYYVRVHAIGATRNEYTLTYASAATSCGASMVCQDDDNEPDDSAAAATLADLDNGAFTALTSATCAGDEDWYQVDLFADESLHVTLTFEQTAADEDLDLQLFRGATNLHPCTETDTSGCSAASGSSTTSNENLVEPITTAGTYYVVVRGWQGAENLYDLCIGLSATNCPAVP